MLDVCGGCGAFRADMIIDPDGPHTICPECGFRRRFHRLDLLVVCGASGTGKSSICIEITGRLDGAVPLDADLLWDEHFNQPEENYASFFETWLRLSASISQAGRPVVLFCAGGIPENIEARTQRRYFSRVHYIGLTCDDDELTRRLQARPSWRNSAEPAFIQAQVNFNRWMREQGGAQTPPVEIIDTTDAALEESVSEALAWIERRLDF